MKNIKYDVPFEVTQKQFAALQKSCAGLFAYRIDDGKYLIKAWIDITYILKTLNEHGTGKDQ